MYISILLIVSRLYFK